jgi:hypothetical protein
MRISIFYSFLFNILIIITLKKFADLTLLVAPVSRHMQWCGTSAMLDGISDVENAATPLPLA